LPETGTYSKRGSGGSLPLICYCPNINNKSINRSFTKRSAIKFDRFSFVSYAGENIINYKFTKQERKEEKKKPYIHTFYVDVCAYRPRSLGLRPHKRYCIIIYVLCLCFSMRLPGATPFFFSWASAAHHHFNMAVVDLVVNPNPPPLPQQISPHSPTFWDPQLLQLFEFRIDFFLFFHRKNHVALIKYCWQVSFGLSLFCFWPGLCIEMSFWFYTREFAVNCYQLRIKFYNIHVSRHPSFYYGFVLDWDWDTTWVFIKWAEKTKAIDAKK